jgi:MoaA/NifB/PqqE/SkfB family radical SAM enzyme
MNEEMICDFTKIPLDKIVKVGQISLIYRDLFTVSWLLGRYCNYNCSYCWPHARSDTKDHRPFDLCIKTIRDIKRQARDRGFNSFNFSLSGGEPTLHPNYLDIVRELASDVPNCNSHGLHMTTNLSRSINFFKEYAEIASAFTRVAVTCSYHSEYAKIDKFIEKIIMLQEHDVNVTINMVMVPEWFERDYEVAKYFNSHNINVTLKPQSDPHAAKVVPGYTEEMLKILQTGMEQKDYAYEMQKKTGIRDRRPKTKVVEDRTGIPKLMQIELVDDSGNKWYMDQAERFNAFNFNKFKGWICSAGYSGIIIREPCGSIKRSYSCIDEPIGNIETGFELFDSPKVCITPSCVSSADSKIPKWRDDQC